jgi:hypothetical protein
MNFRLEAAPASLKLLFTFFLLFVGIGYVFGLVNINNNTGLSYTGVVVHYRGEAEEEVPTEFASAKLIHEHHVHMFSLSMLFVLVGVIFSFTSLPESLKCAFISAPFLGMLLDFTGFWLLVFVSPLFAWIPIVFGGFMALSFFLLIGRPLYEIWVLPIWHKKWGAAIPWFLK